MVSQNFAWQPVFAQTIVPEDPAETTPSETSPPRTLDTLSVEAQDTAKRLGLWTSLTLFEESRQQRLAGKPVGAEYMEARQNLMESVMIVSQDVRTFVHYLEEEVAKADSINAMIAARRDRALKLNTYGDLISGGISGMVSGGLALGDVNHLSYDTIDAVEGFVQSGLALMSLKEQKGEKRIEKGIPNILARLFEPEKGPSVSYPTSVWTFLNSPAIRTSANPVAGTQTIGTQTNAKQTAGTQIIGTETRREKLVNKWSQSGFCVSHHHKYHRRGNPINERQARITNASMGNYRLTAELIEDRTAMLHELRSTVTRLDVIMLELMLYMRGNALASTRPTS